MNKKIAYFAGCTTKYIDSEVGVSTIQVLKQNDFQPVFPDQKCCGTAHLGSGNISSFLKNAEFNVRSLSDADCDIVTACTSCALTLKKDYPRLLGSREAKAVSQRTYDIMEYLVLLKDSEALNNNFNPVTLRVLYHAPCHLKVQGEELIDQRLKLIKSIPGISISCIEKGC